MSGVTMGGKLYTLVRDAALTSLEGVVFLKHVRRETKSKLLVIWDGSPIHRREVTTFMQNGGASHIHLEQLPPYAPELNPDEGVWEQLKNVGVRNLSCKDLNHLRIELNLTINRLRSKPRLIQAFFAGAKLSIKVKLLMQQSVNHPRYSVSVQERYFSQYLFIPPLRQVSNLLSPTSLSKPGLPSSVSSPVLPRI